MLHFEFGQNRLTEPHPLNSFELAQGAIKGAFVLFSTTCSGSLGSFCKIAFFRGGLAWRSHASFYAASSFPTPSSGSSKARFSVDAGSRPASRVAPR